MKSRFVEFTALIVGINRKIKRLKTDGMAQFQLKGPHVFCLYNLYCTDGLTAAELSERSEEDKASISRSLDYLEKNGYLTWTDTGGKKYKSPLHLTEKGREVCEVMAEEIRRIVMQVGEGLSQADREAMYRALIQISTNLDRLNGRRDNSEI